MTASRILGQIQSLEEELGTRLFDRLGKRVALTDAGKRLLPYAEKMLDLAEEARTHDRHRGRGSDRIADYHRA